MTQAAAMVRRVRLLERVPPRHGLVQRRRRLVAVRGRARRRETAEPAAGLRQRRRLDAEPLGADGRCERLRVVGRLRPGEREGSCGKRLSVPVLL